MTDGMEGMYKTLLILNETIFGKHLVHELVFTPVLIIINELSMFN